MNAFKNGLATVLDRTGKEIASMDSALKTQGAAIAQNVSATNDITELIQECVTSLSFRSTVSNAALHSQVIPQFGFLGELAQKVRASNDGIVSSVSKLQIGLPPVESQ
jgi:hypothetical protein